MAKWRMDVKATGIVSDRLKELHITPTTPSAKVGAGFHITALSNDGKQLRIYYQAEVLPLGKKPADLKFKQMKKDGDASLIGDGVIGKVSKQAFDIFISYAQKDAKLYQQEQPKKFDIKSNKDFPALGS